LSKLTFKNHSILKIGIDSEGGQTLMPCAIEKGTKEKPYFEENEGGWENHGN
jgi:hypothetical protein